MKLKDLTFVIPMFEEVLIVEIDKHSLECKHVENKEWCKVSGLNRSVYVIMSDDNRLYIEVYE